jgi:hypothetical protein
MEELPIDADLIREAYKAGLDGCRTGSQPEGEIELLRLRLIGHVQLLLPEVEERAARMRGFTRSVAVHVLRRADQTAQEHQTAEDEPSPGLADLVCYVQDLAVAARSLLELWEHPGPLGQPKGREEIAQAIRRQLCGTCGQPIQPGEESERVLYESDSRAAVHGFRHSGGGGGGVTMAREAWRVPWRGQRNPPYG